MFGRKRRQQEAAEAAARNASFRAWFDAVTHARPTGSSVLTEDLLQRVGSPYALLGLRAVNDDLLFLTAQVYGREWADRLSRRAILRTTRMRRADPISGASVSNWPQRPVGICG